MRNLAMYGKVIWPAVTLALATGAHAGGPACEQKLVAPDGGEMAFFGGSVSVHGDVAVVGAQLDASAYVFRRTNGTWELEQELLPADHPESFGGAVSISGNVAIVGAHADDANGFNSGSAYVFRWKGTEWQQEEKLRPPDSAPTDQFGISVSISGDTAIVGAFWDDDQGDDSGSAHVFRWNGTMWEHEAKLLPSDGAAGDAFGVGASLSGQMAFIAAPGDDDDGENSGSVYVFRREGTSWVEHQKLRASDGAAFDWFGNPSVSGDVAIVGVASDDDNGDDSGSAYVFRWNGSVWEQEQKLLAADGWSGDGFGSSVSISGDVALVGAPEDDDNGNNSGSAYLYRWTGTSWVQGRKLLASDGSNYDRFGGAVSADVDVALIGAYLDDPDNMGSAYAFELSAACLCPGDTNEDASIDVLDLQAIIAAWGSGGPAGDCNLDGLVNVRDLIMVIMNWGPCS